MKKTFFIYLLLLPVLAFPQAHLRLSIDRLLNDSLFDTGDASLVVYDLSADTMLYEHRSHKLLRPASVQKVITSVAALAHLGDDYMIKTELYEGVSDSCHNLCVKGYMDPLFSDTDIQCMANSVSRGKVIDTLFVDCSFTDSLYWGSGWVWDDNPYGFQPYLSPLMVCRGAVEVVVWPSEDGGTPSFKVTPESSFYTVVNEAGSHNPLLGKLTILRDWLDNSNVIRIKGNCKTRYKESINMYKSADFFVAMLLEKLASRGVEVKFVQWGKMLTRLEKIFTSERRLTEVVDEALMESDNLCAEALVYHLAALENEAPLSMKEGCAVVEAFLRDSIGINNEFSIADGSGLSVYNYVSASMLLDVLKYAYKDKTIFDTLYNHLPLAGVSGTMQHRAKKGAAYKKVRAKTGTVKGVSTLAGYALAGNGHTYAFVIMNTGLQKPRVVREWQDRVCDVLCR